MLARGTVELATDAGGGMKGLAEGVVLLGAGDMEVELGANTPSGVGGNTAGAGAGEAGASGKGAATGTPIRAKSGAVLLLSPDPFVSPGVMTATICMRAGTAPLSFQELRTQFLPAIHAGCRRHKTSNICSNLTSVIHKSKRAGGSSPRCCSAPQYVGMG